MSYVICCVDACERPVLARGWCNKHYKRWSDTGDPLTPSRVRALKTIDCEQCGAAVQTQKRDRRFCDSCIVQRKKASAKPYVPRSERDIICKNCGETFRGRGPTFYCGEDCRNEAQRETRAAWQAANGKYRSFISNLKRYGLTPESFYAIEAEQGGVCRVCECPAPQPELYSHGWKVDHDPACCDLPRHTGRQVSCGKCVRGLLCHNCNVAIGLAHEDPDRLRRLAAHIESHRQLKIFA